LTIACSDDASKRFEAYGWDTQTVNGHNMEEIEAAILKAQKVTDKPSIICCKTKIGFCSPLEGTNKVHGSPLGDEGVLKTKEALGMPTDKFHVEEDVKKRFAEIGLKNAELRKQWDEKAQKYFAAHPEKAALAKILRTGDLPSGWESALPTFEAGAKIATRSASGKVLDALFNNKDSALITSAIIGGSADLTPSNNTLPKDCKDISFETKYSGGYVHYGIREHGMGQIMNGLALYGFRPYGGTFFAFMDYMRPSVRAAAMMGLPVTFIWTHDSIGLGEDGPTHQPIEHFTSLRCTPNLITFRPCDANEVAGCWKYSLSQQRARKCWACEGAENDPSVGMLYEPVGMLLSRQNLPVLSPPVSESKVEKGAYVLKDCEGKPDIILMATGSEVEVAYNGMELLKKDGIKARVVSMPSWELFDRQPQDYKDSVLIPGIKRVAVEAGSSLAWPRYFGGLEGACVCLDRYGASAPYQTVYKELGITPEAVCSKAKALLGK